MQTMLKIARSQFAFWMLAGGMVILPALDGLSAELRGRSKARFTRQVIEGEPPADMPVEPMPSRRPAPMQRSFDPLPSDAMPADDMPREQAPADELPAAPRARRPVPGPQVQRGSVIDPYEGERFIGPLGGYHPETARRLGICYPETGACGMACGGCYPCYTWGSVDFVYMWRKGQSYPPLITTNPIGTADNVAGSLDNATTRVLFGGDVQSRGTPGGRAEVGIWANQCQTVGIGGRFLALGDETHSFNLNSAANPIIGVPFFELNVAEEENAFLVAHPDRGTGSVDFDSRAYLYAGDVYLRFKFWEDCVHRLDLTAGYTFAKIGDEFTLQVSNTAANTGTRRDLIDEFSMVNRFEGVSPGALYNVRGACWSFSFLGKCGLGTMHHVASIAGSTTETDRTGAVTVTNGGIFAQPTNIARHETREFAIMPEMQMKIGYRILPCLEATLGYNGIYWNRMAQAGEQVDRTLNSTQFDGNTLFGAPRPEFNFRLHDYYVQGITVGLQGTY